MAITTYTELKTAVETWLHRSDLTALVPDFITLGEARLNRELRLLQQEDSASVSLASAASTATLPTGFLEHIDLRYTSDNYQPGYHTRMDLNRLASTASSRPEYFTIGDDITFCCPADQAYTLTMDFFTKWDIATDTTNWLLTNAPGAYLYASLLEAAVYKIDDKRVSGWVNGLQQIIGDLNGLDGRTRGQVTARVDEGLTVGRTFDINRGY